MKTYIKPTFACVELRADERLAGSPCVKSGSCFTDKIGCTPGVPFTQTF